MKTYVSNKKALFNYEVLDTFEAGIQLSGAETKSIKSGKGSLLDAFVVQDGTEVFLVKMFIPPYQPKNISPAYDPYQKRRLLLRKSEIARMVREKESAGLTVVPISLYDKKRLIKVELALVRGKKKHDKRQVLKKREADREIRRALKR